MSVETAREAVFRAFERCLLDGEDDGTDMCSLALDNLSMEIKASMPCSQMFPCGSKVGFMEKEGTKHVIIGPCESCEARATLENVRS